MARTTAEIYASMIDAKNTMASLSALQPTIDSEQILLNDLTSNSKVGRWRLVWWLMAFFQSLHENVIERLAARSEAGTDAWWYQQCLNFQFGDPLVFKSGKYVYDPVIPANRIIKLCAVRTQQSNSQILLKVAKLVAGAPTPLSAPEFNSFTAYVNTILFAGTTTLPISSPPDVYKLGGEIFYDPLILAADGSLLSNPAVFPVQDAIENYMIGLPFNGLLRVIDIVDKIQNVPGVRNFVPTLLDVKYASQPYENVLALPGQQIIPFAGHLTNSSTPGETLSDLLIFTADV